MRQLLIASNNPGKVAEFRDLLAGCGWEVVAPRDLGIELEVEEAGASYAENARLKAEAFSRAAAVAALADDSGLEVDALHGEPGPLHHLKGWDGRDPSEHIELLLNALHDVAPQGRTARFRAVVVVVFPDGSSFAEEGACEGVIAPAAAGAGGFGYDPVFFLPALGKTMAELTLAEKNRLSHRAVAAAKVRERLIELASSEGHASSRHS